MVPISGRNREETRTDATSKFLNEEDAESQKAAEEKNRTRISRILKMIHQSVFPAHRSLLTDGARGKS
jgi:hypothetical protein